MNVTHKHLKAFVAISETGSFADAASLIHCSQPALSVMIKNLEMEIGGRLFMRTTRSLALTPEGKAFLPTAKRLLGDWTHALDDLKNQFSLQHGKVGIAAIPSFACNQLPDILRVFKDRFPEIHVGVDDVTTEDVVELVNLGRVEVGVTFDPGDLKGLNFQPLFDDRFVGVVPKGHALTERETIEWSDLLDNDFIKLQKPSSVRELIDQHMTSQGLSAQSAYEAHQLATIGRVVASGLGVSVIPSLCARQMEEMGAVCVALNEPQIVRQIGVLTSQRAPLSVASTEMIKILKKYDWSTIALDR